MPAARRFPWENLLASTAILVVARAALFAAQDFYLAKRLFALAASSFARDVLSGLPAALAGCALAALALRVQHARRLVAIAFAAFAYLYLTGRLPSDPLHVPGAGHLEGLAAFAGAVLVALGCTYVLAVLPSGRLARALSCASCVPVLLAIAVRITGLHTSSAERGPNVVLISLDTLRADRLGSGGMTPNIDRFFGASSVQFRSAFAPQPFTLVSHASLLTGLDPGAHGVDPRTPIAPSILTLTQRFRRVGYLTLADVDLIEWLHQNYGFARGFRSYARQQGGARVRVPRLLALLDDLHDERFFLFLHFYDAHSDRGGLAYDSDPEDRRALGASLDGNFRAREESGGGTGLLYAANQGERVLEESERAEIARQYDAGVRTLDRELGPLFERLEDGGFLDDTLVILVSDHGEELFEHKKWLHSQLYDECVHVPMLFRLPGRTGVRTNDDLVSLIDVAPTVVELCGLPGEPQMQGHSLVPLLGGASGASGAQDQHVFLEWEGLALRTREWKLIERTDGTQLYRLSTDPEERVDLAHGTGMEAEVARLSGVLQAEAARCRELRDTIDPQSWDVLTDEEMSAVRALGYAGGDE